MQYNYFNPQRYLLSQSWQNAIQALINIQTTLSQTYGQFDKKLETGLVSKKLSDYEKLIRKIGQFLKEPTNAELKQGILLNLTKEIDIFLNTKTTSNVTNFQELMETYGVMPFQAMQMTKRIELLLAESYKNIQVGLEEKVDLKTVLNAPLTKSIFKGVSAVSPAINTAVFGAYAPVANLVGGTAMKLFDKVASNKYNFEKGPFKTSLPNRGILGGIGDTSNFVNSAMPTTNTRNIQGSFYNDIFNFFNRGAFQAIWTKKVLAALENKNNLSSTGKGEKGGNSGFLEGVFSGSLLQKVTKLTKAVLPAIGAALPWIIGPAIAAIGGWKIGKEVDNLMTGKNPGVQTFFEKTIFKDDERDKLAKSNVETNVRMPLVQSGMDPKEAMLRTRAHFHPETIKENFINMSKSASMDISMSKMLQTLQDNNRQLGAVFLQNKTPDILRTKELRKNINDPFLDLLNMGLMSN